MEYSLTSPNHQLKENDPLRNIYAVNAALMQLEGEGLSIENMLPRILQLATDSLASTIGSIIIIDPESHIIDYAWLVNPEYPDVFSTDKLQEVVNDGFAGKVIHQRKTLIIDNCLTDPNWLSRSDYKHTQEKSSAISTPIIAHNQVIGTITILKEGEGQFEQIDTFLLNTIAEKAAYVIANAHAQDAENRYLSLFQDSVDPIILTNLHGQIIEANQRAFELFGYDRAELIQMTIGDLHADALEFPKSEQLENNETIFSTSQINTKVQLKPLYVEVYGKLANYGKDQIFQWIHHDITKQVELEEMRQDLTAMLVHDLQSPLSNVIASLELITNEVPEESDAILTSMLDIAIRSSNHLQTLIHSLMDISRLEAGHPISKQDLVDVEALVDIAYEIERPNFEKRKVKFKRDFDPTLRLLLIEESIIRRVLLNLLDNSLKYGLDNQEITVRVRFATTPDMALISVIDHGQGIPKEFREKIFAKFHRISVNPASRGLGLGLAFCHRAVEAHGGQIWVNETPGGGATFNFTVPLVPIE